MIFIHQNLISNQLTYLENAKSTDELISFGFSDRSVQSSVSAKCSANRWDQKKWFHFWLIFGLSPNLGLSKSLSKRLIQKVKSPNITKLINILTSPILPYCQIFMLAKNLKKRIEYKHLSLTEKVLATTQPIYLHNLISIQHMLQSYNWHTVCEK